jgi:hypothetical protein
MEPPYPPSERRAEALTTAGSKGTQDPASPLVLAEKGVARAVIVVTPDAGLPARFAAEELKAYLDRVTGGSFIITSNPPPSGTRILVGDSQLTRQFGIGVEALKRDGFFVKRIGNAVAIAGRDDKRFDVRTYADQGRWTQEGTPECATVFGVYYFLETIGGVRWYFPGAQGEIVPLVQELKVNNIDVREEPWLIYREVFRLGPRYHGVQFDLSDYLEMGISDKDSTYWGLRNRSSTLVIPLNHMPSYHTWAQRFGKTHPNWFALKADGTRDNVRKGAGTGHLCYSNPEVLDEMFREVEGFFSGEPASKYGLVRWRGEIANNDYFSLLPEDGMRGCHCPLCQKMWSDKSKWSELVWGYVANIGRRLEKNHPGKYLTCLAYTPYVELPKTVELPSNILIGVATEGCGSARDGTIGNRQLELIRRWKGYSGSKVVLWTYNCREVFQPSRLPGIPQLETRALGRFFRSVKDDIVGSFYENDLTCGFQNLLNQYLYFRITWNPNVDVNAVVDEYCRKTYGAAGEDIGKVLDRAEKLWFEKILRPVDFRQIAGDQELWEDIYSKAELGHLQASLDEAEKKVAGTEYAPRVGLFRQRFLGPLLAKAKQYNKAHEAMAK